MTSTQAVRAGVAPPVFRTAEQQDSFDRFGYVLAEWLDAEERRQLLELFDRTVRRERNTYEPFRSLRYYISIFDQDIGKRKEVDRAVKEMFRDKLDRVLPDHRVLLCNFMAKEPGGVGEIQVHQDFSFVDEERYVGFNLWIPLEDTDTTNGCFYMIPGSHRLLKSYRAASITESLTQYNDVLKRYMVPRPVKAGWGLLFDHRLFHYSPENDSQRWRPAVQLVVIPRQAEAVIMQHDRAADPDHLKVCRIDEDYLTGRNLWEPAPDLEVVGTKDYIPLPAEAEIIRMVEGLSATSPSMSPGAPEGASQGGRT